MSPLDSFSGNLIGCFRPSRKMTCLAVMKNHISDGLTLVCRWAAMSTELVKASSGTVQVVGKAILPVLVERAGGAARFAWDEFFYAEHHNPHTQKAYQSAVRRFLAWAEGQGVELASITPGMVGQYVVGLGGSAAKRNQYLSALRGFFDRLVQRHVFLNPAVSVSGVKEQVIEG